MTGKNPVLTGKHAQMTGFSRHLTGKFHVQSLWVNNITNGFLDDEDASSEGVDDDQFLTENFVFDRKILGSGREHTRQNGGLSRGFDGSHDSCPVPLGRQQDWT